jgi:hypothetical protein
MKMKLTRSLAFLALAVLLLIGAGCASTRNTIDTRKQERYGAYSSLSPEFRALVDAGKIKVGMPMDAVYMAWGEPAQVVGGESAEGAHTTWIYRGTQLQEYRYWGYRPYSSRHRYNYSPSLEYDYYPTTYTSAEVTFENGVVKQWRTFPTPAVR